MINWLKSIWDTGADILGAAKDYILKLLTGITTLIDAWISDLLAAIAWVETQVTQLAQTVADGLVNAISTARNIIISFVNDIYRWASAAFNDINNAIRSVGDTIFRWAEAAFAAVASAISDVYHWAQANIFDPLMQLASAAWHFATVTLPDWVTRTVGDVFQWAKDAFNYAWSFLSTLWNFFTNVLEVAWPIITKAWDWLVWFATHPISMGMTLLQDITRITADSIMRHIHETMQSTGEHIIDTIAKYLSV